MKIEKDTSKSFHQFASVNFPSSIPPTKTTIMTTNQNTKNSQSSFTNCIAMKKIFPKIGLFLILITNVSPALAASKSNEKLEYQHNSQGVIVAGLFGDLIKTVDNIDRTRDRIERRNRQKREREQRAQERKIRLEMQQKEREQRLKERQAREEERKRRQEEYAAARRAATQKQLEEAERRRQYFESLSPEQKQTYFKQQQALRQKQAEAGLFLLGLFLSSGGGGGSSSSQQTQDYEYINKTSTPSYNPAPAPVTPIGGNSGFYGTGPGGSFYGN